MIIDLPINNIELNECKHILEPRIITFFIIADCHITRGNNDSRSFNYELGRLHILRFTHGLEGIPDL